MDEAWERPVRPRRVVEMLGFRRKSHAPCIQAAPRLRADGERGTALIELALILPILAILVFGTIDLGRGYAMKNELTNMAREGSFLAIRGDCSGAVGAAQGENAAMASKTSNIKLVSGTNVNGPAITSCPPSGSPVTMVVQSNMTLLTPLVGAAFNGGSITLSGTSTVQVP